MRPPEIAAFAKLPLLPHEWLFGFFLLVTWLRWSFALGALDPDALIYLALFILTAGLIGLCALNPNSVRWRLRCAVYPLVMSATYMNMAGVLNRIHAPLRDSLLQRIDALMVGTNLSIRLQAWTHPAVTEVLSFCYMLYIPYLYLSLLWYWLGDLSLMKKFYSGVMSLYAIGLLGYTLVPAWGPYLAMGNQFQVPLTGGWFTHWNEVMVMVGSNKVDVFPSLHCAASSFILFFDRKYKPWRYWLHGIPVAGLWVATIYLRYHYLVDVICGFALCGFVFWRVVRWTEASERAVSFSAVPRGDARKT